MPHIIVKLWPGNSEQDKARLTDEIVKDVMNILNQDDESVSVQIDEIAPQEWTEKVYKADIVTHWDLLYKKPGYVPVG